MQRCWDHNCFNFFPRECCVYFTKSDMMSLAVSDPTQKNCGDSRHPVCNYVGTTSSVLPRETGQTLKAERK